MNKQVGSKLVKWPFYVGDVVLLGAAWLIYSQSKLPMGPWETLLCVLAVAIGAWLGVTPYLLEYRAAVKLAETDALADTVTQIQHLDLVAIQINRATAQWQGVQEESTRTIGAAREIADRMTAETKAFTDFMQRANNNEKSTMRLEIEKLHRAENDWLQVLMQLLDHVYALHKAALHSGQRNLIEQIGHFQNACHDVSRRIGLIPFVADIGDPFNVARHRLADDSVIATADACVSETIATGYTYQGQLLRRALVSLQPSAQVSPLKVAAASPSTSNSPAESIVAPNHRKMTNDQSIEGPISSDETGELIVSVEQPPLL